MQASVPVLLEKIGCLRPRFVCFIGMGIWVVVRNVLLKMAAPETADDASPNLTPGKAAKRRSGKVVGKSPKKSGRKAGPGLQPFKLVTSSGSRDADNRGVKTETLIFVVPSTSGRVTSYQVRDLHSSLMPIY